MGGGNRPERLDKWVASQGKLSRRQVRDLARAGQILVNGASASSGEMKVSEGDVITVQGREISLKKYVYIMMNKPSGVISATEDRRDRTVLDLVPGELFRPGLFPAGRLDKDSEGFVLITNDGPFAHKILSPAGHVPKTYYVRAAGDTGAEKLISEFAGGVDLGGGEVTSPAELAVLRACPDFEAKVTIYEGMYHQVKRMFARYGMEVTYLKRLRIGGLELDPNLLPGECRIILHDEVISIC